MAKIAGVFLHRKGKCRNDVVCFKKASAGAFKFCIDRCDKSRRVNSFVEADDTFGRIAQIFCSVDLAITMLPATVIKRFSFSPAS